MSLQDLVILSDKCEELESKIQSLEKQLTEMKSDIEKLTTSAREAWVCVESLSKNEEERIRDSLDWLEDIREKYSIGEVKNEDV
jgi:DNA/RNA-binding domain of Phe-tRNA-synthetase-like protein